ncbi:FosX/FosE/FosI family fosfomycin resistance thiol transferase [Carnobacterium maltaromaticum]|uniref:FosX/FosE/FosI family fosfomycin resistance hydrolase n=1 Tax=Carnobacterium maltaromaticum TaxID=2751 RepID=UPI000C75D226|nr:FosX/FosE/FosI family fosfomycin resistance hydrolase [Carnobacterium maltaromaticum]PLS38349.1 FosX/FosE/FosI family fosfomycin resistance thiol transferase [Carnobacterium maltaromaticum]PLS38726.1 FosX/FosE/FosI family fosfomycin resistance thiol transferase [Carnobacterium maltaromaticum]PLS39103.1 FosX/FosE/FosI family fosfomycin resistance thiol transferase [Carnobacterium maltaromaticum]PLS45373.1 FosX/FosE/FosI family fosfomycin resistance thiol transferase [Carnobacterium maltaromat
MIEGLSHMTFIVENLEKTKNMLEYLFSAEEVYSSDGKNFSISNEKFFIIGNIWIAIMENKKETLNKTYNHIAFKINKNDYDEYLKKIKQLNLETKSARSRVDGEGSSIYFYDYDHHLFELHTGTLEERLNAYRTLDTL